MSENALHDTLARLLVGAALDPSVDPADLAYAAESQGVAGLLLDLPAFDMESAAAFRKALLHVSRRDSVREMAAYAESRRVLDLLSSAGIAPLVLKGVALGRWLYSESWHRPCVDLDLLVVDQVTAQRVVALMLASKYELLGNVDPTEASGFEVALQKPGGMVVDLHWRLLNHALLTRYFSFDELAGSAQSLPKLHPDARGLGKRHALLHALLHRVTNIAKGEGERLIWLWDIHLLVQCLSADDWEAFLADVIGKKITTPCLEGFEIVHARLGTVVPESVVARMRNAARNEIWNLVGEVSQGAMDRAHLAALSWSAKPRWIWNKVFPSREFMRFRYGVTGGSSLVLAYLQRWWIGLRRAIGGQ